MSQHGIEMHDSKHNTTNIGKQDALCINKYKRELQPQIEVDFVDVSPCRIVLPCNKAHLNINSNA